MKNIKNKPEDKMYKSPRTERIHTKYAGSKWDDGYYINDKKVRRWINRFLIKHIGKSYDKTYSEFLSSIKDNKKNMPKVIDGYTIQDIFKGFFKNHHPDFIVVDGIIRKVPEKWKKEKKNYYYEYPEGHNYRYTLKSTFRNPDFISIITKTLGCDVSDRIMGFINENEYNHILKKFRYNYNWYNLCGYRDVSYLFDKYDIAPRQKIEYTKSMRKKDFAESRDAYRKNQREKLKVIKKTVDELLNTLENNRKEIEKEKNSIDIERLGFDENTSFRGEFYHGQKRKKK